MSPLDDEGLQANCVGHSPFGRQESSKAKLNAAGIVPEMLQNILTKAEGK